MTVSVGTRFGPYEILGQLGAGGMGEVYKAHDSRLDRIVAIKILPEQFAADPGRRERFEREARAVASLNHPHICHLHDIGDAPNPQSQTSGCRGHSVPGDGISRRTDIGGPPRGPPITRARGDFGDCGNFIRDQHFHRRQDPVRDVGQVRGFVELQERFLKSYVFRDCQEQAGEVYRAHVTTLGREVAIKILPDTVAHDQERLARFELRSCENNSHDKMCGL